MKASTEARRQSNARSAAGGNATRVRHKREPVEMDWDAAIARLKAMLDNLEERK